MLRLGDELSLHDLPASLSGGPGPCAIRCSPRNLGAATTRSELEVRFLDFVDEAGLPAPHTNAVVEGLEVDCLWCDERLAVELDGPAAPSPRLP